VPVREPRDPEVLLRPAVEGTLRALRAARDAGIGRVVLTSSSAAITSGPPRADGIYDENCWSDPDAPDTPVYNRAKTLAERAAWDYVARDAPEMALTAINPVVVVGPPLDGEYGASVYMVARLLEGRDPLLPRLGVTLVDVRDVADAHLAALDRPGTAGQRYYLTERFLWMREIAGEIRAACPESRVARRQAPDLLVRALGLVSRDIAALVPRLGQEMRTENGKARRELGLAFRDTRESLRQTARALQGEGVPA
jgi:dihydroflavonol-4-reductase